MSNEQRQPLLTEEQIQEMMERTESKASQVDYYLWKNHKEVWHLMNYADTDPVIVGMDKFLAFLRGQTKRVLNLDRLRADVKAWVDDPNRKYPEWFKEAEMSVTEMPHGHILESPIGIYGHTASFQCAICSFASIIGINPDDYFEEVEVTE